MAYRSNISTVFDLYDKALPQTRDRLEERVVEGTKELEKFYNEFLKDHVIRYSELFNNDLFRKEMHIEFEDRYRSSELRFWALNNSLFQSISSLGQCLIIEVKNI